MLESYKNTSRLWTLIMALLTAISMIGVEEWQTILPQKYVFLAPIIVAFLGYFVAQYTEEKRVNRAEELVHKKYSSSEAQTEEELVECNDYIYSDSEDSC